MPLTYDVERPITPRDWLKHAQQEQSYWLTRFVILRLLGFIYLAAFVSLACQVLPLIGSNGLLPADDFLVRAQAILGSRNAGLFTLPSLFWLGISDRELLVLA
jgi:hypothetical protein